MARKGLGKLRKYLRDNNLTYKQYLDSPHWHATRTRFYASSHANGGLCFLCDSSEHLNVHHKRYDNLGCEDLSDLVPLCGACHRLAHNYLDRSVDPTINLENVVDVLLALGIKSFAGRSLGKPEPKKSKGSRTTPPKRALGSRSRQLRVKKLWRLMERESLTAGITRRDLSLYFQHLGIRGATIMKRARGPVPLPESDEFINFLSDLRRFIKGNQLPGSSTE